ncbi:conserved hypothetical protein [Cupriavidus taiwanensis]|uniref:hypothetical protein n=1 Tax=Cupriavidus taiwanensis TaxID=164546 RepID=UPI000E157A9B|nr:hypothetical protein [Cupriavidus taiwanensis]SPA24570.1 conserved hypothetical protein [Cupriavidus taiwanensis]
MARPSEYKAEYAEQAYKLCLLGATDKELADFFQVTEQTVNNWKKAQPEFFESITRGKMMADAQVAESLFKRALGYSHQAEKIMVVAGTVQREEYTEHYPPDTPAASLWLRNRQPEKWRDRQQTELTGKDGENLFAGIKVTFVKPE